MAVSEATKKELYSRAGGRCECEMRVCDHTGRRCSRGLSPGYWDAHHKVAGVQIPPAISSPCVPHVIRTPAPMGAADGAQGF